MLYIMKIGFYIGVHNVICFWGNFKIEKHTKNFQQIIKLRADKIMLQVIIIFIGRVINFEGGV